MPTVVLKASEFGKAIERHLGDVAAALTDTTWEVAQRGVTEAVRLTKAEKAIDTGQYMRGFHVTDSARRRNDGFRDRRFKRRGSAILVNNVPHALDVEFGRRPGAPPPPVDAIRLWARRKFGIKARGKGIRGQSALDWALINAIRWGIHHRGIRPKHIMLRTARAMERWFHAEIPKVLSRR